MAITSDVFDAFLQGFGTGSLFMAIISIVAVYKIYVKGKNNHK